MRRTDHGLYRCTVTNKAGRAQAVGQILVRSEPEMELIPSESTYFVSHKPWIASCLVTGYPLAWEVKPSRRKRSVEFEEEYDRNRSTESTDDSAIPNLRRTDHGLYRCTVTNKAGRAQAVGQILVRSEPEMELIPSESTYFVSHKPWIASCLVTGYPLAWEVKPSRRKRSVEFEEEYDRNRSTESTDDSAIPSETPPATNSSVQLKLFTMDGQPMNRVTINLINYEGNKFFG
ncbi:hypothetical protein AHF37_11508 [Paragonimus kellicotti]|nr:hypothetical protein AHF37_11508 [Paragonimus kellicotti]